MVEDTENNKLPRHIAIIMDGNGRWAARRGLPRSEGHKAGAAAVRDIVTHCRRLGIGYLTLYAFSSENWNRPKNEIAALFRLLLEFLNVETPLMVENDIRLNVIGDITALPAPQRAALRHSMSRTGKGRQMVLNLAINYGGRTEIARAVKNILLANLTADDITEQSISDHLYTAGQPDPDLLIRTSGELRLSNFLLYQCAYSELYFTETLWPDFDSNELGRALNAYAARSRRFGRIEENPKEGD